MLKALPVLMYHHISPSPGLVTLAPAIFRQQVEAMARSGWKSVTTQELEAFFRGQPLPDKCVLITFDDGYLDNFVYAHPVLAEFGFTATLFIVSGWIGEGPARQGLQDCPDHRECKTRIAAGRADEVMLRWSEIEAMQAAGTFEFHSHTHSHTRWDKSLPAGAARAEALARDLEQTRQTLRTRLGHCSTHLCWPQGYFEPDYLEIAQTLGFRHLYTTRPDLNLPNSAPLHIGRLVTKEKTGRWIRNRLSIYATPWLGQLYNRLKGHS
ncbi:polysaccharide deacetylase family protein [Azovibrio restrictus]|uniref:polysaccharide deacetylase family protein n=1 Tax=Azovibrio restrictus TaxID=146938 RepID=UPI0026EF66CA|nr:polysaccharide deacetylase family protein [Azovibrio restrictus]MDD3483740.1 polysaccharide deacetylase family protein [Azovibrio restrictus]